MTFKRLLTASLMLLFSLTFTSASYAQEKVITGKVTDSKDGSPIAGASVIASGAVSGSAFPQTSALFSSLTSGTVPRKFPLLEKPH